MFLALLHVRWTWKLNIVAMDFDTHRFLQFSLSHTGSSEDFHYVDVARMLSGINRKTFRQGMTYDVANIVFHNSADDETLINVCTAPNNWVTQVAWQLGFRNWLMQQRAALDAVGLEEYGPWHDFKVYMNNDHISDVDKPNFIDCEDNTWTAGEWIYSKFIIPDEGSANADTASIGLLGPHVGTPIAGDMTYASLYEAFENVITQPAEDPDLPAGVATSLYQQISPDASDSEVVTAIVEDFEADNDLPPYSPGVLLGAGTAGAGRPSEPWISRVCCIPGGGAHMAAVGGFSAPCGLVMIETKQDEDDTIGVTLELVPGNYKGVSARPMRGGGF